MGRKNSKAGIFRPRLALGRVMTGAYVSEAHPLKTRRLEHQLSGNLVDNKEGQRSYPGGERR